jgi:hypothetical protein
VFDFIYETFKPSIKMDNKITIKILNEIVKKSYKLPVGKIIKLNLRDPKRKFNYQQLCRMKYRFEESLGLQTVLKYPAHNPSYDVYKTGKEYPDSFYVDPTDKSGLKYPIGLTQRGYLLLYELEKEEKKMKFRRDETRYGLIVLIVSIFVFVFTFHRQIVQFGIWLLSLFS